MKSLLNRIIEYFKRKRCIHNARYLKDDWEDIGWTSMISGFPDYEEIYAPTFRCKLCGKKRQELTEEQERYRLLDSWSMW